MKANEAKLEMEKRRLKEVLDASESRSTKLEVLRRSLEGDLQRAKLSLGDREMEIQVLRDRIDVLQRQVRGRGGVGAMGGLMTWQPLHLGPWTNWLSCPPPLCISAHFSCGVLESPE